jgi:ATP-dependent DNA helicase PIF1
MDIPNLRLRRSGAKSFHDLDIPKARIIPSEYGNSAGDSCHKSGNILNAVILLEKGHNVIITGSGGTGKSHCLKSIVAHFRDLSRTVALTAMTGVAASNLNHSETRITASTLHSWAGIGIGDLDMKKLYAKVMEDSRSRKRWKETDLLIIDEVSMLGKNLFDKLEYIGRKMRDKTKPFGGMRLLLCGDFYQLPPVKDEFIFESEKFEKLCIKWITFSRPFRYNDIPYYNLLLRVREGRHTKEDIKILKTRMKAYDEFRKRCRQGTELEIKPTVMYSRKADVSSYNLRQLSKLTHPEETFIAEDDFVAYRRGSYKDYYIKILDDIISKHIVLKIGAQVMLKYNMDVGNSLTNGSRGVVLDISSDEKESIVTVKFINDKIMRIKRHTWTVENDEGFASRCQMPLVLAYASTIHKAQGSTLDYAVCDLGPSVFEYGQAYVALSRVRNLQGLFVSIFEKESIKTDPKVVKYLNFVHSEYLAEDHPTFRIGTESSQEDSRERESSHDLEFPNHDQSLRFSYEPLPCHDCAIKTFIEIFQTQDFLHKEIPKAKFPASGKFQVDSQCESDNLELNTYQPYCEKCLKKKGIKINVISTLDFEGSE